MNGFINKNRTKLFIKQQFLFLLILLLLGCIPQKGHRHTPVNSNLSIEELLKHANYLLTELKSQGFEVILEKPRDNQINLDTKINERSAKLLLDTGATFSFLNKRYLKRFQLSKYDYAKGMNPSIKTCFGEEITDSFPTKVEKFVVGDLIFQPWPFIVHKSYIKHGIMGVDFLHFTCAVIICRPGAVFLTTNHQPAKNIGDELKKFGYSEIELLMVEPTEAIELKWQTEEDSQISLRSGVFMVPISFENIKGMAILDTGASFSSIKKSLTKKLNKRVDYHPYGFFIRDAKGKRARMATICLNRITIDSYSLADQQYVVVLDYKNKNLNESLNEKFPLAGIIGFDILVKNNAIIDFGNKRLYLQN